MNRRTVPTWCRAESPVRATLEQYVGNPRTIVITKPAGSAFQYRNTSFKILVLLVQSVSGGYRMLFGRPFPYLAARRVSDLPAVVSSAEDMLHYASALLNGGRYDDNAVISPFGIRQMFTPSSIISAAERYGLGWHMDPGGNMMFHGGSAENFQCNLTVIPQSEYAQIVLYNTTFMPVMTLFKGNAEALSCAITSTAMGVAPPQKMPVHLAYVIQNVMMALLVLILAVYLYVPFLQKRQPRSVRRNRMILNGMSVMAVHFVLPLAVIIGFPAEFATPWKETLPAAPDIALFMFAYSAVLVVTGIIRCFLTVRFARFGEPDGRGTTAGQRAGEATRWREYEREREQVAGTKVLRGHRWK